MIIYLVLALFWGVIFGMGVFPVRARYRIECPSTLGWRATCTIIHSIVWPFSVLQIAGWIYLDSRIT